MVGAVLQQHFRPSLACSLHSDLQRATGSKRSPGSTACCSAPPSAPSTPPRWPTYWTSSPKMWPTQMFWCGAGAAWSSLRRGSPTGWMRAACGRRGWICWVGPSGRGCPSRWGRPPWTGLQVSAALPSLAGCSWPLVSLEHAAAPRPVAPGALAGLRTARCRSARMPRDALPANALLPSGPSAL